MITDLPNGRCASPRRSSRRRKSESSPRPAPSPDSPRQDTLTLSASQACPPSPDCSGCRTAERSARAASPAADAAVAPCGRPSDTSAQCGHPGAPGGSGAVHPLRKDLVARPALLAIAFEAGKGQLLKSLHVVIPERKTWRKTASAPRIHNATPQIRLYSEVP